MREGRDGGFSLHRNFVLERPGTLVLVPICAGTGSIVFVQAYGDPYARGVLDGWMDSFRWTDGRNLTACDFLDPK